MAHAHLTRRPERTEEAITALFCLIDDAYRLLNPRGHRYGSLKRLSDSEVLTLALLQQLRGVESQRSFLRDAERFFCDLFPGVAGLAPSSFHRRARKLRRFLEPLRRSVLPELAGDPETLIVDSTLLPVLHPRQVRQSSAGFEGTAWARWGSFAVYGVKLHLLCATNRVPISYELTAANVADVLLVRELLEVAHLEEGGVARRLLGGPGLPKQESRGGAGRVRRRAGGRAGRAQARREAAGGGVLLGPQASLRLGRDAGEDAHGAGDEDRSEGGRLHLRLVRQQALREAAGSHQGAVGLRFPQHSSSPLAHFGCAVNLRRTLGFGLRRWGGSPCTKGTSSDPRNVIQTPRFTSSFLRPTAPLLVISRSSWGLSPGPPGVRLPSPRRRPRP